MEILCKIRDISRSIAEYSAQFEQRHHLSLNEGMLLCSLSHKERCLSGDIASTLGLSCSNTSKVIKSVESKGLIERVMGELDRRQMYFSLTKLGEKKVSEITANPTELPQQLKSIV